MPTIDNFNGQQVIEPGAYSQITSSFTAPAVLSTFSIVVIIDTGLGAGYGWGGGIDGQLTNGAAAVYSWTDILSMQAAIRGGLLWDLMNYLWIPSTNGQGPSQVYLIRACTTTAPILTMVLQNGGTMVISAKNEGTGGNGSLTNGVLTLGYGAKLRAGYGDNTKYAIDFYEGEYRGVDQYNNPFDTPLANVLNNIISTTPEMATTDDFMAWATTDPVFTQYFQVTTTPTAGQSFTNTDITNFGAAINVFTGGTAVFSSSNVDDALAAIEEIDSSLFLCLDYGIPTTPTGTQISNGTNQGAECTNNVKILSHILNNATYTDKIMFVGGGQTHAQFMTGNPSAPGSVEIAEFYNSESVILVHSDVSVPTEVNFLSVLYHAAMQCGRTAGLQPQVPLTYKDIRVNGVRDALKKTDRGLALTKGVCHLRNVPGIGWAVNQGVNTVQNNGNIIGPGGITPEISIKRIKHQLNKELKQNAGIQFPGNNINTIEATDVVNFTQSYLLQRTATKLVDNLILSFSQVTTTFANGNFQTTYCFVANGPINKAFFTGYIMDATATASGATGQ